MLGEVVGDHHALPVVPTVHAEHVRAAFLGQLRARRAWVDHKNPCLLVHFRGRDRGVRAPVPDDDGDAIADQLARERHRLIGIAVVVADDEFDFLAEHAALGVEVFDRDLGAALIPVAGPGVIAGHRAGQADPDVRRRSRRAECRDRDDADDEQSRADHGRPPTCGNHSALLIDPPQCGKIWDSERVQLSYFLAALCSSGT
jgi:hypothetical protein